MKELKDVKEGDYVYHVIRGWEKVQKSVSNEFPLEVGDMSFNTDGREYFDNKNPTIYPSNPLNPNDHPPCDFKKGEVIAVADEDGATYYKQFHHYEHGLNRPYICTNSYNKTAGWEHVRKLAPTEKGHEE